MSHVGRRVLTTLTLAVLTMASASTTALAQTVANGPYFAVPAWDQTLPSSTRFIVLSNMGGNAVLDRETGLVWERSPSTAARVWFNAHDRCNDLTLGNRKGWRVPTVQELASLLDGDPANVASIPRLPPGHPFVDVVDNIYWSATTSTGNTNVHWAVYFGYVNVGGDHRVLGAFTLTNLYIWCVRGGASNHDQ